MPNDFIECPITIEFPKIVIVGCESAGKSSLIERLAGFRVFPVGEDLTTRMPIAMNLKTASEQLLKDICVQHKIFYYPGNLLPIVGIRPYNSNNLQYFICPYAGNRIQQEMEKYIRSVNNGQLSGIWDQEFVIEVLHPRVPNLQLVDLPGVVSATRTGEPPSLPEQTLNLSRRYVSDPFSLIIAVIPCMEYIVNNRIVGLIQECGAINRSLCVLTKIDITRPLDVVSRVSGISPDAEPFRTNGYLGISNSEFHPNRSFEDICAAEAALCQMLANEPGFNNEVRMRLGIGNLVSRILLNFESHFKQRVIPTLICELDRIENEVNSTLTSIGTLITKDNISDALQFLQTILNFSVGPISFPQNILAKDGYGYFEDQEVRVLIDAIVHEQLHHIFQFNSPKWDQLPWKLSKYTLFRNLLKQEWERNIKFKINHDRLKEDIQFMLRMRLGSVNFSEGQYLHALVR